MESISNVISHELSPASTACKHWEESRESSISVDSIAAIADLPDIDISEDICNDEKKQDETRPGEFYDDVIGLQSTYPSSNRGIATLDAYSQCHIYASSGSTTPVRGWPQISSEYPKNPDRKPYLSTKMIMCEMQPDSAPDQPHLSAFQSVHDLAQKEQENQKNSRPPELDNFFNRKKRMDSTCVASTSLPTSIQGNSAAICNMYSLSGGEESPLTIDSNILIDEKTAEDVSNMRICIAPSNISRSVQRNEIKKLQVNPGPKSWNSSFRPSQPLDDVHAHHESKCKDRLESAETPCQPGSNPALASTRCFRKCNQSEHLHSLERSTEDVERINSKTEKKDIESSQIRTEHNATADISFLDHAASSSIGKQGPEETKHTSSKATKMEAARASEMVVLQSTMKITTLSEPIESSFPHDSTVDKEKISVAFEVSSGSTRNEVDEACNSTKREPSVRDQANRYQSDSLNRHSSLLPSSALQSHLISGAISEDHPSDALSQDCEILELRKDLQKALRHESTCSSGNDDGYTGYESTLKHNKTEGNGLAKAQGQGISCVGCVYGPHVKQLENQRHKGADSLIDVSVGCEIAASDASLPKNDVCAVSGQNDMILLHRISVLQSRLDVQLETSKKLATMCTVLREERLQGKDMRGKDMIDQERKLRDLRVEGHSQYWPCGHSKHTVSKALEPLSTVDSHRAGRLIRQHQALEVECIRLREQVCLLQSQFSKERIRAIKSKECSRLREVVQMVQMKLSFERARALKAEKRVQRLNLKMKADCAVKQPRDCSVVNQNTVVASLREEVLQQNIIIQDLRAQNKRLEEQVLELAKEDNEQSHELLRVDPDAVKRTLHECETALCQKVSELNQEQSDAASLKLALENCETKLSKVVLDLSQRTLDAAAQKNELENCKRALSEKTSALSLESMHVASMKRALEHCEMAMLEKASELSKEKMDAEALKRALAALEVTLSEKTFELTKEIKDSNAVKNALAESEKAHSETTSELNRLQAVLDELKAKSKMMYCDLQDTISSHEVLLQELHLGRANEARLQIKIEGLESRILSMSDNLQQVKQENRILKNRLNSAELQYGELERALHELHERNVPSSSQDLKNQASLIAKDAVGSAGATESWTDSEATLLEKRFETQQLALEHCKSELEILRDFRKSAVQDQSELQRKHSQQVADLTTRVEQESARARANASEIARLSSECSALQDKEALTLRQHAQDLADLKQNYLVQVEKVRQEIMDSFHVSPSFMPQLEQVISSRFTLSIQDLKQKTIMHEAQLADNLRNMEAATKSMKDSAELIGNLQNEMNIRDAALAEEKDKSRLLNEHLLSALQALEGAEKIIHKLDRSLSHSMYKVSMLQASLVDLSKENSDLVAALTKLEAKLDTESRQQNPTKETGNGELLLVCSPLNEELSQKPSEDFEKPSIKVLIDLMEKDPMMALQYLVAEKETILQTLMHPKFSNKVTFADEHQSNDQEFTSIQKRKEYTLRCYECDSLRRQITDQEENLANIQNEIESLRRQNSRSENELVRLKLTHQQLKKEHSSVENELIKCKSDIEVLKLLQKDVLIEKENLFKQNVRLLTQLKTDKSGTYDHSGANHAPASLSKWQFQDASVPPTHGFFNDDEVSQRETNILVGLVKKLLQTRDTKTHP